MPSLPRFADFGEMKTRLVITVLSFVATLGVSGYIVVSSWRDEGGAGGLPLAIPLLAHVLALSAMLLEISARAIKLVLSGAALGIPLPLGTAFRTVLGGDFASAVTPARSGSEPARYVVLAEAGIQPAGALLLLFAELFLEMLTIAVVASGLAIVFDSSGPVMGGVIGVVGGYSAFVLGVGALGVMLSRRNASGPPPRWARWLRLHAGRWRAVQRALRQLRSGIAGLRDAHAGLLLLAFVASIVHLLLKLAVLPILVWSLAPDVPLDKLLLWPLALFNGAVVAPAPGGGGFVEVAFRAALGGTIPAAVFGVALIWWRVYTFYLYIPLGAVAAGRTVMRVVRSDDDDDDAGGEDSDTDETPVLLASR